MKKGLLFTALALTMAIGTAGASLLADRELKQANALSANYISEYAVDPDIDVGLHITASDDAEANWTMSVFYVNGSAVVGNFGSGDYIAIRVKATGGSWFDFIPNIEGNAPRVSLDVAQAGVKFVPVNDKVLPNTVSRTWDLPMNLWAGMDGWICMPKSGMTRYLFGSNVNWSGGVWACYFYFYGTTIDTINFDIGDVWTANIDGEGYLQKVTHVIDWTSAGAGKANVVNDTNMAFLDVARNNENLVPGAKAARAIMDVDVCDAAACTAAYNANKDTIAGLDTANAAYFREVTVYDYEDEDTAHTGGRHTFHTVGQKWDAIVFAATGVAPSAQLHVFKKETTPVIIAVIAMVSVLGLTTFLVIRSKKAKRA